MINFLEETKDAIKDNDQKISNIIYIGSENGKYVCKDWNHFKALADFEYDDWCPPGEEKGPMDIMIRFEDGTILLRISTPSGQGWDCVRVPSSDIGKLIERIEPYIGSDGLLYTYLDDIHYYL